MKFPRILYFIKNTNPTTEDMAAAKELGMNAVFRVADYIPSEGALEQCDGVAGLVPARYAAAYPKAEDVLAKFNAELNARAQEESEKVIVPPSHTDNVGIGAQNPDANKEAFVQPDGFKTGDVTDTQGVQPQPNPAAGNGWASN